MGVAPLIGGTFVPLKNKNEKGKHALRQLKSAIKTKQKSTKNKPRQHKLAIKWKQMNCLFNAPGAVHEQKKTDQRDYFTTCCRGVGEKHAERFI